MSLRHRRFFVPRRETSLCSTNLKMMPRVLRVAAYFVLLFSLTGPAQLQARSTAQPGTRGVSSAAEKTKTRADEAYREGRYTEAISLVEGILRRNPQDHVALYLRASSRVELGLQSRNAKLIRAGIEDARLAISHMPDDSSYFMPYLYGMTSLAVVEQRDQHAEIALQIADGQLKREQKPGARANLHYQRGRANIFLKRSDAAIADLQATVQASPAHLAAWMELANVQAAANQPDAAEKTYASALKYLPNSPLIHNNRGRFRQQQGRNREAIADFSRALQLDSKFTVALSNRGFALMADRSYADAEADFEESILTGGQANMYGLRGAARMLQGRIAESLQDYKKYVELAPDSGSALAELGLAQAITGNHADAIRSFDRALKQDSTLTFLAPWRYHAMVAGGQQEQARATFNPLLTVSQETGLDQSPDWTRSLLEFLDGRLTGDELLAQTESEQERGTKARRCEALYFIGAKSLSDGNDETAARQFELSLSEGQPHLAAFRGAALALRTIKGG